MVRGLQSVQTPSRGAEGTCRASLFEADHAGCPTTSPAEGGVVFLNVRKIGIGIFGVLGLVLLAGACLADSPYTQVGTVQTPGLGGSVSGEDRYGAVATRAGYIYTLYRNDRLLVFDATALDASGDIQTIDTPVADVALEPGDRTGLLVVGSRLYCYGWRGGLVFDISDPATPVLTGRFGDDTTHILDMDYRGGYLFAACYDRLVIFSFLISADFPTVAADLSMDRDTYVYEVCTVGTKLCGAGYRRRESGLYDYWLGMWDNDLPERASLAYVVATEDRGYRLAAAGEMLLAISESDATLWELTGRGLELVDTLDLCGRSMAVHRNRLILTGGGLAVSDGAIELLWLDTCPADELRSGLPSLGASNGDMVVLPDRRTLAVLQECQTP